MQKAINERAAQLLDCAAKYIAQGWTQNQNARDANGEGRAPGSPEAVCWCAQGALVAAHVKLGINPRHGEGAVVASRARDTLGDVVLPATITEWNDAKERTWGEVATAFRTAAARLAPGESG